MRSNRFYADLLRSCLQRSYVRRRFNFSAFFEYWFKNSGSSYFFLFKKNLRITNIQFAELLALLRAHLQSEVRREGLNNIQFLSYEDFQQSTAKIVSAFGHDPRKAAQNADFIAEQYFSLFSRIVVVEPFFCSASVHIPATLGIDLGKVCAFSGYIHSCGNYVYVRDVNKARMSRFIGVLSDYLQESVPAKKKAFFTVYAHEDFSDFDRDEEADLNDGLDEVKIFVDKFYMGSKRLVEVLKETRSRLGKRLKVPDPGNYRKLHRKARQETGLDNTRTLWLITDRSVSADPRLPGGERYLL